MTQTKAPVIAVDGPGGSGKGTITQMLARRLGWDLLEAGHRDHDYPAQCAVHEVAIPHMGMPLLDNSNFDRLAAICRELDRYEFHLSIAPLVVEGGTGSPVNPIATF